MERVAEETDILIIGGGPAGMAAAIRARQIAAEKGAVSNLYISVYYKCSVCHDRSRKYACLLQYVDL